MLKTIKNWVKKFWEPPALTNNWKTVIKKKIASEWRELLLIDLTIIAFMIASVNQLAVFFANSLDPGYGAWLKAIAFDAAIYLFSRNVSRAYSLREKSRGTWFALVVLAFITVFANIGYEWFLAEGGIGDKFILRDWILNIRAGLISGSLPIIVVFMSTVRALAGLSFERRRREFQDRMDRERKNQGDKEPNGKPLNTIVLDDFAVINPQIHNEIIEEMSKAEKEDQEEPEAPKSEEPKDLE